jgi:hypothetical protein
MENNDGFAGDRQLLKYLEIRFLETPNLPLLRSFFYI